MKSSGKIFIFLTVFTIIFYLLRNFGSYIFYDIDVLVYDLPGLVYLYSTIGIIFAIFAAFVILTEVERWNSLVDSVKGEVGQLKELWLWSRNLSPKLKSAFNSAIKQYLEKLIKKEWRNVTEIKNSKTKSPLDLMHDCIYNLSKENSALMTEVFSAFKNLLDYREKRIHYSSFHLPKLLKRTLLFSDIMLVVLSLLIGVHNPWLNYIFVASIATLGYVIYLLVEDMDNPTRPGGWHITTADYETLLLRIDNK